MLVIKCNCDFCGKEIEDYKTNTISGFQHGESFVVLLCFLEAKYQLKHLCLNCAENIQNRIDELMEVKP